MSSHTMPKFLFLFAATTVLLLASVSAQTEEIGKEQDRDENWRTVSALMRIGPIVDVIDEPIIQEARRKYILAELEPLLAYLHQKPESRKVLQLRSLQRQLETHEHELMLFNLGTYDIGSEELYTQTRDRMYRHIFELKTEIHDLKRSLDEKTEFRQKKPATEQQGRIRELAGRFEESLVSAPPQNSARGIYLNELRPLVAYLRSDSGSLGISWRALLRKRLARKQVEFEVLISNPSIRSKGVYFERDKAKRSAEIKALKNQIATGTKE